MKTATVIEYRCENCNETCRDQESAEDHELVCFATKELTEWAKVTPFMEQKGRILNAWKEIRDKDRVQLLEALHSVFRDQLKREQQ